MLNHDTNASQQISRELLDSLAEGIVWQAVDGRVIDANASAAPILGLTHDELLGRTSRDPRWYAVHEDGSPWPGDEHPAMVALRSGQPQRGHVMGIIAPDRGRRWIGIHAMPLFEGGSKRVTGVVTSFADVTDHVELSHRARHAAREFAELYDRAPCGYHALDEDGCFTRINDTALSWLGVTRDELIGKRRPVEFLGEQGQADFRRHFPRLAAGESIRGIEVELFSAQGQRRVVRLDADPVQDAHGRFLGTRSALVDVTDSHDQAVALARLSAEQAAALNNDLISIVRMRGRTIVWTNRAFDRIFGYETGEMLGQSSAALFADQAAYDAFSKEAGLKLSQAGEFQSQCQLQRKDGSRVWVDCSGAMLNPASREVLWFSKDVTEQRRAEELRHLTVELEARNREMQETSRLHSSFLSNMSHELRTPLNAVIGFGELLQMGNASSDPQKVLRYAQQICGSGRHLLSMIESILEAANADAGRLALHPEWLDPRDAVGEVVAMLEAKAAAHGVTVVVNVDPDLPALWIDPLRLRQVLLNYIGNAIKFSHPGGRVDVRLQPQGPDRFRIEVEDRGIGIAPGDQARLFERFRQLKSGPSKPHEGTGIGLALVRLLVEQQHGTVDVRSEPGIGSVFAANLPIVAHQP